MDSYHVFLDGGLKPSFETLCGQIHDALLYLRAEFLVVNTPQDPKEFVKRFPDALSLKIVNYTGNTIENEVRFCQEFPAEWVLFCQHPKRIPCDVVGRYKLFSNGAFDRVYVPAFDKGFDLSGHLAFMSYYSYRRLDPTLSMEENFFELTNHEISFIGVQGVIMRKK